MTEKTQYTVFYSDGGHQHNEPEQGEFSGADVSEIIVLGVQRWPDCIPVAWAPEWLGGGRSAAVVLAESLAAGRTIELIDGKYVARGVAVEEKKEEVETDGLDALWESFRQRHPGARAADPNAAMIARDGPVKPQADWNPIYLQPAPKSTAKPALSALLLCADLEPRGYLR